MEYILCLWLYCIFFLMIRSIFSLIGVYLCLGVMTTFAAQYEVVLPVLLDPAQHPYHQIPQQWQTILSLNHIGHTTVHETRLIDPKTNSSSIPDVRSDASLQKPVSIDYICAEPQKNGKAFITLPHVSMSPLFPSEDIAHQTIGMKMYTGTLDGVNRLVRYMQAHSSGMKDWWTPNGAICEFSELQQVNWIQWWDSVTYRIQYPVGTRVWVRMPTVFSPLSEATIRSNYTTHTPSGTGILFVSDTLDSCRWRNSGCQTHSIEAVSLSGVKTELLQKRESYRKEYAQMHSGMIPEYFPIPADTATLTFTYR